MEILKTKKYLGMIGTALVIVGLFLPFASISVSLFGVSAGSTSISLFSGAPFYAILVLACSILSLLVIFSDKLADKAAFFEKLKNQKIVAIASIVSAVLVIINAVSVPGSAGGFGKVSLGFGFWIIVVGLVAAIAYPFLYKGEN
ncbi:MAG: hypothetical protein J6N78_00205 [Clostridia bacterium]|nr:hypothetical protein [Clostridia bacterium]